ncbi:MAG: hypothetical protein OEZ32_14005 [Nitrospinota bacterium]|nr:hypothetical protein [Nitrospinota bacterium]
MSWGLALLGANLISSFFGGEASADASRKAAEEAAKNREMQERMFQQKMALEKSNAENQFALSGAQLVAQYGAPGQAQTVTYANPEGSGGGRRGGPGSCPPGSTYVRREKGEPGQDGKPLVAGIEWCQPD